MSTGFVRPARTTDIPAILDCTYAQWKLRVADESYLPPRADVQAGWSSVVDADVPPGVHALVATEADAVVGWLLLAPSPDPDLENHPVIEILDILVHPAHHRAGHGSRLIHAAAAAARRDGFTAMSTWVLQLNEDLREFLGSQGFGPDGSFRELTAPMHDEDSVPREFRLLTNIGEDPDDLPTAGQ